MATVERKRTRRTSKRRVRHLFPNQCPIYGVSGPFARSWACIFTRIHKRQTLLRRVRGWGREMVVLSASGHSVCARLERGQWRVYKNDGLRLLPENVIMEVVVQTMNYMPGLTVKSARQGAISAYQLAYCASSGNRQHWHKIRHTR